MNTSINNSIVVDTELGLVKVGEREIEFKSMNDLKQILNKENVNAD